MTPTAKPVSELRRAATVKPMQREFNANAKQKHGKNQAKVRH